jgi:hypothetical protein
VTTSRPSVAAIDPTALAAAAAAIAEAVGDVFLALEQLGDHLARAWQAASERGRSFDTGDLAALQTAVFTTLDQQPAFESAGFVLAEETLADRDRHLDWWHRNDEGGYEFLVLNLDPDAADCYDYYSMEWFLAATDGHRRFVSGPLIDLPCADVYIMTFSSPIVLDGRLLGVAGADVAVSRFESRIVPPLRSLSQQAVLVNRERRVIASNGATYTTGEKLPTMPGTDDEWSTVVLVTDDLGWALAVADRAR